jgi:hypothetical protein
MRYCLLFLLLVMGCTVTVPDYTSAEEDNGSPWIDVYGDTMKDFSIYVTYSDGKVVASISGYSHPDSMNFIDDINVSISEFSDQDVPLLVCYGSFPGTTNAYIETVSYRSVADSVSRGCDSLGGDMIDFQITRIYSVPEGQLPETLKLLYDVKTSFGNKNGKHSFKKVEREIEQSMRFH